MLSFTSFLYFIFFLSECINITYMGSKKGNQLQNVDLFLGFQDSVAMFTIKSSCTENSRYIVCVLYDALFVVLHHVAESAAMCDGITKT